MVGAGCNAAQNNGRVLPRLTRNGQQAERGLRHLGMLALACPHGRQTYLQGLYPNLGATFK
jgi:hypothetical protein